MGTFIHKYAPHVKDWRPGDPTWKGGKGKGIIGALNYLAGKGMNSVYFLTYNLDGGDGRDTWMWTDPKTRDRFDASKLDQWEIVFTHMDRKGMMLHVVTQETENDRTLGGGPGLNPVRMLYYRELAARFSHHPALIWNLGEENNTPDKDRKEIARYIRALDAYRHPITVHTKNNKQLNFYDGLFGDENFEATSIQGTMANYNRDAIVLRGRSAAAGRKWVIFGDEQPPAAHRREARRRRPHARRAAHRSAVGQPDGRRRRSGVVLRQQVCAHGHQLRGLPLARPHVGPDALRPRVFPSAPAVLGDGTG